MPISSIHCFADSGINPARTLLALATCLALVACDDPPEAPAPPVDVLVIGGGIAGLSAALEASAAGASVTGLEMNSVGGGHAVMAGGLFLVDTPLQRDKNVQDSVELAVSDMLAWGEDAREDWVRRYAEASGPEVHDWLTQFGVEFALLMPAPGETSVPRFHFTRGTAVNVVVPLMRASLAPGGPEWRLNTEAVGLRRMENGWEVDTRHTRTGAMETLRASAVILATGGFENDLQRVLDNWLPGTRKPERLLAGAGHHARGSGLDLGRSAGAALERLDHQTIFVTGMPDPRDATGQNGLLAQNPAAIFVDSQGRRFMNESAPRKTLENTVLALPEQSHWLIFDSVGRRRLQLRGAPWLDRDSLEQEILDNPQLVQRADTLAELARRSGLPPEELTLTVARYNARLSLGEADEFGRFGPGMQGKPPRPLAQPPYYALRLYPMTRKSMGGLAIDAQARVTDPAGKPLPGLYAAGELTGVAGINGSHGGSGTFLGPSVYTGRVAGRSAAGALVQAAPPGAADNNTPPAASVPAEVELMDPATLDQLLATSRPGYWHFEQAHSLVRERGWNCGDCHGADWPTQPARTANEKRAQLESCARCH